MERAIRLSVPVKSVIIMSHCAIKITLSGLGGRDSTPRHSVLILLMAMIQVVLVV